MKGKEGRPNTTHKPKGEYRGNGTKTGKNGRQGVNTVRSYKGLSVKGC